MCLQFRSSAFNLILRESLDLSENADLFVTDFRPPAASMQAVFAAGAQGQRRSCQHRSRPCDERITSQTIESQLHFQTTSVPLKSTVLQGDRQNAGSQGSCQRLIVSTSLPRSPLLLRFWFQEAPPDSGAWPIQYRRA